MNLLSRIFKPLTAFILGAVMLAVSSCEKNGSGSEDGAVTNVIFTISMGELDAGTRASNEDWTDYDPKDEGTDFENKIDVSKLYVYFYDNNGAFVAAAQGLRLSAVANSKNVYQVVGKLDIPDGELVNGTFSERMAVFANMDKPGETALLADATDVSDMTFSFDPEHPSYLPMWGLKTVRIEFAAGKRIELDDTYLLRSMAKITVSLTQEMIDKGYAIDSLALNRYNTVGYCLPGVINGLGDTQDLTFANTFHVNESALNDGRLGFAGENSTSSKNLYVPEFDNSANPSTISIKLKKDGVSEGKSYTLRFTQYDSNNVATDAKFNITRNHWYQYKVYKYSEHEMRATLSVRQWNRIVHEDIIL